MSDLIDIDMEFCLNAAECLIKVIEYDQAQIILCHAIEIRKRVQTVHVTEDLQIKVRTIKKMYNRSTTSYVSFSTV